MLVPRMDSLFGFPLPGSGTGSILKFLMEQEGRFPLSSLQGMKTCGKLQQTLHCIQLLLGCFMRMHFYFTF